MFRLWQRFQTFEPEKLQTQGPGPRRNNNTAPNVDQLDNAELVEPVTSILAILVWKSFKDWCLRSLSLDDSDALMNFGPTPCMMVESFGRALFEKGDSIYVLRQRITLIQRWRPEFKSNLGRAWQLISRWETLEPSNHRHLSSHGACFFSLRLASLCWHDGSAH